MGHPFQHGVQPEVLFDGEGRVQDVVLGTDAEGLPDVGHVFVGVSPGYERIPFCHWGHPRQHSQERCLPHGKRGGNPSIGRNAHQTVTSKLEDALGTCGGPNARMMVMVITIAYRSYRLGV